MDYANLSQTYAQNRNRVKNLLTRTIQELITR